MLTLGAVVQIKSECIEVDTVNLQDQPGIIVDQNKKDNLYDRVRESPLL
jgi:hypothetical protein